MGQAVEHAPDALLVSELLPRLLGAEVEEMVAALHLRLEIGGHVVGGELAVFFAEDQLPGEMKQEVAYLLTDGCRIAGADRMVELVDSSRR
ncbi:MAG: hypothetical protein R2882_05545 [Gemmatimonadales bacterium]